ncbi:MAG: 1,6-anhydro-N-acetylmuramyl-L-alanine amidase AmpD [Moritella sp.]|uniref:1,6-anhydro-N-acetylmuramyl-L-alanine amidase AmpD n=1 Tax=Moritella sp. TaxID=78556 RepID=UPI0029A6D654|nr:1,6-anhydro-N-acetylmuramyl-L-alanine amidase AmpD [Moritella sp.]MDX2319358.1 1,6-anhydro-N-acetylmuramyl-L-alanine amidase AmpD [Moritella sp.]
MVDRQVSPGLLASADFLPSPHFDERPADIDIDLLVIHCISLPPEQYGGDYVEDFFRGKLDCSLHPYFQRLESVRVSAHLYIKRDGQLIQFVPLDKRAWHAGLSEFSGKSRCNDFSIGIELEGDVNHAYTSAQYQCLVAVTKQVQQCYPLITQDRITGHSDIAPVRKDDPGPHFDWSYYFACLNLKDN